MEIKNTHNSAAWDLSIEGSKKFNKQYQSNDDTYYFSYSTSSTKNNNGKHIPIDKMSYYLRPGAYLIGSGINNKDSSWYENDGIVNTISMSGPHDEKIIQYNNKPVIGRWNHMGILNYDHHQ